MWIDIECAYCGSASAVTAVLHRFTCWHYRNTVFSRAAVFHHTELTLDSASASVSDSVKQRPC